MKKKIIEILLNDTAQFPENVKKILTGPESAMSKPFSLNETFTLYFLDTSDQEMSLVNCELALPETIGNEMFLVQKASSGELAFLEYMGPALPHKSVLTPYIESIIYFQNRIKIDTQLTGLAKELSDHFSAKPQQRSAKQNALASARLFIFGPLTCYYLGTSVRFLAEEAESAFLRETGSGCIQHLTSGNNFAVEGWCMTRGE